MFAAHLAELRVDGVEDTGDAVVISASCQAASARCPRCGTESSRVHGGYLRLVAGGAVGGRPVLIALRVRRFRCRPPSCPGITFAGQAEGLTSRYRRRSVPLTAMLAGFGLELAGRAAARLGARPGGTCGTTWPGTPARPWPATARAGSKHPARPGRPAPPDRKQQSTSSHPGRTSRAALPADAAPKAAS